MSRISELSVRLGQARESRLARDVALVGARAGLTWIFIFHGARTLFGAFGGPGIHRASIFYGTIAHLHPATFFTVLGGGIELFGAIAVGVGVFGRLGAVGLAGDMVMAMVTVTFANGMASSAPGGGYELNLALATLASTVAVLGTGRFSLDALVRGTTERAAPGEEMRHADRSRSVAAS